MKEWLEKWKGRKGLSLLLALLMCLAGMGLFPLLTGESRDAMTSEEKRISAALSRIEGAGETRVAIYYAGGDSVFSGSRNVPSGAIIVSAGARDLTVRLNLMRAAQTLLGLGSDAVEVFAAEEEK